MTVSQATVWQKVYGVAATKVVPLIDIVQGVDMEAVHTYTEKLDTTNDTFVYELYYKKAIAAGQEIIVFETVTINENLTREQAAEMSGEFFIKVVADAVQVENVGNNVYEAFTTVGLN